MSKLTEVIEAWRSLSSDEQEPAAMVLLMNIEHGVIDGFSRAADVLATAAEPVDEYRDPLQTARRLRRFALTASKDTHFRAVFKPIILEALDQMLAETAWLDVAEETDR